MIATTDCAGAAKAAAGECPFCGSPIEGGSFDVDGDTASQPVACTNSECEMVGTLTFKAASLDVHSIWGIPVMRVAERTEGGEA